MRNGIAPLELKVRIVGRKEQQAAQIVAAQDLLDIGSRIGRVEGLHAQADMAHDGDGRRFVDPRDFHARGAPGVYPHATGSSTARSLRIRAARI